MACHEGLQRLPLPPPPPSLPPGGAARPPRPGTEKPSGVCLGLFEGRRRSGASHEQASAAVSPVRCRCVCRKWLYVAFIRESLSEFQLSVKMATTF